MDKLKNIVAIANGNKPADLLIRNARVVNVFTGKIDTTNVAVSGRHIAGLGDYKQGKQVIDARGKYLIPGLMDAHIHLESTLLTPAAFATAVIPHGTTSIFIDPHEIANVLGIRGVEYILRATEDLPLNVFLLVPSCVPATDLETSGAIITADDIAFLLNHPRVVGLAEMMNYPGVLSGDVNVLKKIKVASSAHKIIDGHAPSLSGHTLQSYISTGIDSDHETTRPDEAREKLAAGMWLMLRQGTAAKNLVNLLPAVDEFTFHRCVFCTDDREPADLLNEGHIDYIIREAINAGLNPIWAIKMATFNCAQRFGLKRLGAIAPGYQADMVLIDDLKTFNVEVVIKNGEVIFADGILKVNPPIYIEPEVTNTIHIKEISPETFSIHLQGERARVIGLVKDQIITQHLVKTVRKSSRGEVLPDPEQDIIKIAVIERHRASGNIGLGLISGLGLKRGAIASSVGHDSHNIIVAGTNNKDMYCAVKAIKAMQGGFVVVENSEVKAGLALPVAGLISPLSAQEVAFHIMHLCNVARDMGATHRNPFLTLSFVALPVIPALRLTDKGLVDVNRFSFLPLEV